MSRLSTESLARASARHRWTAIGAWIVVFAAAIALASTLLGDALTTELTATTDSESVEAERLLRERLGESNNTIGEIAVVRSTTLTVDDPAYRRHVEQLYRELLALSPDVVSGGSHYYLTGDESLVSADRRTTFVQLVIPEAPTGEIDQVHRVVEAANRDGAFQVLVTGEATLDAEITEVAERDLATGEGIGLSVALVVLVLVFCVLGLSFVLLMVAFRSIVIAVKAILMNLLSVGAALGLTVLVFQKGVGADLLGLQQVDLIQNGLPLFLFVILFGLSMDYHVFLLSRVRERFVETGDNGDAVAYGLRATGRLISGAALIMVAVFGGFALGDLAALQQFGFGLAVAVLVDATIVRCILVPASMRLLGRWNWYLPNFLRWLPELRIESAEPAEGTS